MNKKKIQENETKNEGELKQQKLDSDETVDSENQSENFERDSEMEYQDSDSEIVDQKINFNISFIESFHNDHFVSDFYRKKVVYLIAIGLYKNKLLIKYGKSAHIFEREFYGDRKIYGKKIKMLVIIPTDNNIIVETEFGQMVESMGLKRRLIFNGKVRNELFVINDKFTLNDAIKSMKNLVQENPVQKIEDFEYEIYKNIVIEEEHRKRIGMDLETEQMKLKTKQKELETNLKLKLLDSKIKKLDLQLKKN